MDNVVSIRSKRKTPEPFQRTDLELRLSLPRDVNQRLAREAFDRGMPYTEFVAWVLTQYVQGPPNRSA